MTTPHSIEPGQAAHQAAAILVSLEYINQAEARSLGPLAEAVANIFMMVYYQSGRNGPSDQSGFLGSYERPTSSM